MGLKKKKPKSAIEKFPFLSIGFSSYLRTNGRNWCIHLPQENFTDALFKEDCQPFKMLLSQMITKRWEELLESDNCFSLKKPNDRKKLGNFLGLTNNEINNLINNEIYQVEINKGDKFRVYGIIKEIRDKFGSKDYFEILLFDPNHLFYTNEGRDKYPFGDKAICLMECLSGNKIEECFLVNETPKNKNLIRKK
jgi:hypothetical protein